MIHTTLCSFAVGKGPTQGSSGSSQPLGKAALAQAHWVLRCMSVSSKPGPWLGFRFMRSASGSDGSSVNSFTFCEALCWQDSGCPSFCRNHVLDFSTEGRSALISNLYCQDDSWEPSSQQKDVYCSQIWLAKSIVCGLWSLKLYNSVVVTKTTKCNVPTKSWSITMSLQSSLWISPSIFRQQEINISILNHFIPFFSKWTTFYYEGSKKDEGKLSNRLYFNIIGKKKPKKP